MAVMVSNNSGKHRNRVGMCQRAGFAASRISLIGSTRDKGSSLCRIQPARSLLQHAGSVLLLIAATLASGAGCSLPGNDSNTALFESDAIAREQASGDQLTRSLYGGIGLGVSRLEPDTSQADGWEPDDTVAYGGQIQFGLDLSKAFSVELHSADLGSGGLSPAGRINYHINGLSALMYAGGDRDRFKRRGLSAYGRVGYGALENTPVGTVPFQQINANHVLFGAGVEYNFRGGIGARAEVMSFDQDVQYAQLGMIYRLGQQRRSKAPAIPLAAEPLHAAAAKPAAPVNATVPVVQNSVLKPVHAPVVVKRVENIPDPCPVFNGIADDINFLSDSATLTPQAVGALSAIAGTLKSCRHRTVTISAHTDDIGTFEHNRQLSHERARMVARYLIDNGVDKKRLRAFAYGEAAPIHNNRTADGRRLNRRVEIVAR